MSKNKQQNKRNKRPQESKKHLTSKVKKTIYATQSKANALRVLSGSEKILKTTWDLNWALGFGLHTYLKLGYRVGLVCKQLLMEGRASKLHQRTKVFDLLLFSFICVSHRAFLWRSYRKYYNLGEMTLNDGTVKSVLIKKESPLPENVQLKDAIKGECVNDLLRKDLTCIELVEILVDNMWDPCYFDADVSKEYFKEKNCKLAIYITTGFRQVNTPCAATLHIYTGDEDTIHTFGIMDFNAKIHEDEQGKKWLYYDPCELKFAYVGPRDYYPHLTQMTDELRLKLGYLLDYVVAVSKELSKDGGRKENLDDVKKQLINSQYFEDEDDFDEAVECLTNATFVSKPLLINDLLNDNQKFTLAKILALPVSFMQKDFNKYTRICALEPDGLCHKEKPCERQILRPRHINVDIPWGSSIEETFDDLIQEAGYEKDEAIRVVKCPVPME